MSELVKELRFLADSRQQMGYDRTGSALDQSADRIEKLEAALRPFAERAGKLDGKWLDHETHWSPAYGSSEITIGDLRNAYKVFNDRY